MKKEKVSDKLHLWGRMKWILPQIVGDLTLFCPLLEEQILTQTVNNKECPLKPSITDFGTLKKC